MTLAWFHRHKDRPEEQIGRLANPSPWSRVVLLACPVLFSAYVATSGRAQPDDDLAPSGTPAQDEQVFAYAPYVKATDQLLQTSHVKRDQLLAVANKWDKAVQNNTLNPILNVSFEDNMEEGARAEIFQANSRLTGALIDDAQQQAAANNTKLATQDALLAMRLTESLKYSDFHSVFAGCAQEGLEMAFLRELAPEMDPATKAEVRAQLAQMSASNVEDLDALTRASRIQYYDYMARMGKQPISIEDVHRTAYVTKRVASDPAGRDAMQYVHSALSASLMDSGPEYLSDLRLAWAAQKANTNQVDRTLKAL